MANISYGVNILPKINNTYTLGNSSYKWHAYLASINGQAIEELVLPAVTSSDNDKILKVSSGAWTVGDAPSGLPSVSSTDNGKILSVSSGEWTATIQSNATTSAAGLMSAADKNKLDTLSNLDVQIDGTSIVSNGVANIPIANDSTYGVTKTTQSYGITVTSDGTLRTVQAADSQMKAGTNGWLMVPVAKQHQSVFYGLAKAAGDSTQSASSNAIGVYTDSAKTAIQSMLGIPTKVSDLTNDAGYLTVHQDISGKADKANTVLTTTLSRGRTAASTVGSGSIAFGDNVQASGMESQAFGYNTKATASWAHAEGLGSIASAYAAHAEGESNKAFGEGSHAEGLYTQSLAMGTHSAGIYTIAGAQSSSASGYYTIASGYATTALGVYNAYETADAWVSGTSYSVGDYVFYNNAVWRCSTANSDSSFDESHWSYGTHWFLQIGNGQNENNRSNAFAVSTGGDGKFLGDAYVQCNADSSGGLKVATVSDLPTTMTGATSSTAGSAGLVPAPGTGDVDKFLAGDGTYKSGGLPMVVLSYGSSTWQDFINAYNNNVIVYCRASSNANPATGSQTRMAFMAYVNNATTPTNVEFQYYRSVNPSNKSMSQLSDQVFVYKLDKTSGWSVTTREASIKSIVFDASTGLTGTYNYSTGVLTITTTT